MLRATPNFTVLRPADATETVAAWRLALSLNGGPVALVLTRQKLPIIDRARYAPAEGVARGAYVLAEAGEGEPQVILIASGSEVHLALEAPRAPRRRRGALARGEHALPHAVLRPGRSVSRRGAAAGRRGPASVEAAATFGWRDVVGDHGRMIGLDRFSASAPAADLFDASASPPTTSTAWRASCSRGDRQEARSVGRRRRESGIVRQRGGRRQGAAPSAREWTWHTTTASSRLSVISARACGSTSSAATSCGPGASANASRKASPA